MILQDIQKAFSATPQQVEQNIKQVVETEQRTKENYVMEQQIKSKKVEKPSYFGSLFGEGLDDYKDQNRERKSSRFDFIKEQ